MLTPEQIEALAIRNAQIDAETRSAVLAARRRKAIRDDPQGYRDCMKAGGTFEPSGDCFYEVDVPHPAPRKRRTLPKAPAKRKRRTLPKVPMAGHVRKSTKTGRKSAKKGQACRRKKTGRFTKCRKSTSRKASRKYDGHFALAGLGYLGQGVGAGVGAAGTAASYLGSGAGLLGQGIGLLGQGIASPYVAPVVGAGLLGYGAKKAIGKSCTIYPYTAECMVGAKLLKEGDQIRDPATGLMHCVNATDGWYGGKNYEFGKCAATPSSYFAKYF
jgi:hypothetical protein